jgi:hypothetical protein
LAQKLTEGPVFSQNLGYLGTFGRFEQTGRAISVVAMLRGYGERKVVIRAWLGTVLADIQKEAKKILAWNPESWPKGVDRAKLERYAAGLWKPQVRRPSTHTGARVDSDFVRLR